MKLVLASFFELENHGSGKKIGICPKKPNNIEYDCSAVFRPFSPEDIYWDYHKMKNEDYEAAGEMFNRRYKEKLDEVFKSLEEKAAAEGKTVAELLPFEDGDTLLSWENKGNLSFRSTLAKYLEKYGYDVEEN